MLASQAFTNRQVVILSPRFGGKGTRWARKRIFTGGIFASEPFEFPVLFVLVEESSGSGELPGNVFGIDCQRAGVRAVGSGRGRRNRKGCGGGHDHCLRPRGREVHPLATLLKDLGQPHVLEGGFQDAAGFALLNSGSIVILKASEG